MFEQKWKLWLIIIIIIIICYLIYIKSFIKKENKNNKIDSGEKFTDVVKNKIKIFNFNTSWCGWSRRFQPEWNKFVEQIKTDPKLSHVEALDIKCDDEKNNDICNKYQVPGYPYVVIEINGKQQQYNGERTASGLIKFILHDISLN